MKRSHGPLPAPTARTVLLSLIAAAGVFGAFILGPVPPDPGPGAEATDPTIGAEHSLAVLPPTDLEGDSTQAYFVEGMHDDLVSRLARVGALRVISRRSTARYAGSDKPLPEIARELGVDELVGSALVRSGDTVSMDVRLVQAVPEERLRWSETFSAPIRDVFALHGDVARAIARQVQVGLAPDEPSRLTAVEPVNPETYEAYLRGMRVINRGSPQAVRRRLDLLHEAIDRNPADARAYAGLATGHLTLGHSPVATADV